jgi:DNA-binding MarR family transcriptional regulator
METFRTFKQCVMAVATDMYSDVGMGGTQVRFLMHIAQHGRISQADLARATETDPALTGRALQTLLERDVIRRERSELDRREYLLDLGPAGRESLAQVERAHARLADRIVLPLDDRDLKDFERITKKLVASLGQEAMGKDEGVRGQPPRPATTPKKPSARKRPATPKRTSRAPG